MTAVHRLATDGDLKTVYDIYMHESVVPFLGYDPMSLDTFKSVYTEFRSDNSFFIYEIDGAIAGFYKIFRRSGRTWHVAYLGILAVSPQFQGAGVGKRLMSDVIKSQRQQGVKRIELIVESDNTGGVAFYKKLGFEIEGTLKNFYKRANEDHFVDDYIMGLVFN